MMLVRVGHLEHVFRLLFRVSDARAGPAKEEGAYDGPEDLVLRKG